MRASNVKKDTTYYELLEALQQEGCALCRLSQRAVERYLKGMLYENVNDVTVQETLKATQGFCPAHSELMLCQRNSLGTAILYRAILGHLSRDLTSEATTTWLERLTQQGAREEKRIPSPRAACPACEQRDDAALRYLKPLQNLHADDELAATFTAGSGFCLHHLRQVTARLRGEALERLLRYQHERWEELRAELAEIVRKNDYRFQGEGFGDERDAWLRAVRAVAGEPGVF
jgi:hypothetical protein